METVLPNAGKYTCEQYLGDGPMGRTTENTRWAVTQIIHLTKHL